MKNNSGATRDNFRCSCPSQFPRLRFVPPMDREGLIFLNIPKTAGTKLNRIIEWQYSPLSIFTIDPYGIRATTERFKTFSEQRRRRLRVVRGHAVYGIHEFLPQGATYITMLREPVAPGSLILLLHFAPTALSVAPKIEEGATRNRRISSTGPSSQQFSMSVRCGG